MGVVSKYILMLAVSFLIYLLVTLTKSEYFKLFTDNILQISATIFAIFIPLMCIFLEKFLIIARENSKLNENKIIIEVKKSIFEYLILLSSLFILLILQYSTVNDIVFLNAIKVHILPILIVFCPIAQISILYDIVNSILICSK